MVNLKNDVIDFKAWSGNTMLVHKVAQRFSCSWRRAGLVALFTAFAIICLILTGILSARGKTQHDDNALVSEPSAQHGNGPAPETSTPSAQHGNGPAPETSTPSAQHSTSEVSTTIKTLDNKNLKSLKLYHEMVAYTIGNLNVTVNPCRDFYQYSCGNYKTLHTVYDQYSYHSSLHDVFLENERRLYAILAMPQTVVLSTRSSKRKVKDIYMSCLDDFKTEQLKGKPLIDKILKKTGGWVVLGTWNKSDFQFDSYFNKIQADFGVRGFWSFNVEIDYAHVDQRKRLIEIWPTGISRHVSVYHYLGFYGAQVIRDYKKFMRRVANLFVRDSGITIEATEKDSLIEQFINDTWSIEYQIVQFAATLPPTEKPYENENRLSLGELNTLTNNVVNWVSLAKYMYKGYAVSESTKVVVHHKTFLKAITAHIQKLLDNNNHRVIHNYLTWRTMETYVQDLSWDYVHANREMYVDINGQPNFLGKKKYCFSSVLTQMPDAVGALFVANHFADKNKDKVTDITNAIKNEVLLLLEKTPWMDASTRKKAKEKLAATQYNIGYPELYRNQQKLDNVYADLQVKKTDYFGNVLALVAFKRKITTSELEKGENMDRWYFEVFDTALATVFYLNKVVLPAGLLQFPVYDYHLPHYMTFGSIGTFIGRFLLHLVDVQGSHWNSNNYYMGADKTWWTQQTKQAYTGVKNCLVDMYNQTQGPYKSPTGSLVNRPINSTLYAYQALATASGIRIAYAAYQKWTLTHTELIAPNNLHLSNKKMFFLSFAQTWCTHRGSLNLYHLAMEGTPTEEIKVNFALKGLTEFTQVFNCPPGSAMNPSKKCQLF